MYHVYIGALRPQPGSFNQPKKCHLTPPTAASEVRDLDFGKLKKAYCGCRTHSFGPFPSSGREGGCKKVCRRRSGLAGLERAGGLAGVLGNLRC